MIVGPGEIPLHIACKYGHFEIVQVLRKNHKCDLNTQNSNGDTPLHLACYSKSIAIIISLLEMKCSTNIPNKKGETAQDIPLNEDGDRLLHIACQWGDVAIVRYLITDERCDLNIQNMYSNTPLHLVCNNKSLDIIKALLEMRCITNIPNEKGETAQDIPLNEDGDCLLHIACQWGDVNIVRYLITDQSCDLNIQNMYLNTPLHFVCNNKSIAIIKVLLEMRCSTNIPNQKGETAQNIPLSEHGDRLLHIACQWGDVAIVRYLITDEKCTATIPNCSGNTPLHVACYSKSLDIIKLLLERKYGTNILNHKNETPQDIPLNDDGDCLLHIACQWSDVDIIRYLIMDQRCDLNIQNMYLSTPLHIACYLRSLRIIRALLERRCSTNTLNKKGETPQTIPLNEGGDYLLHIACQWGDVEIVRYLITDERCNPNIQSYTSENTPLHIAAKFGQDDALVQLLSCKGCNPNVQNKEGDTPLHIAVRENKTSAVSQLLANKKCNPNVKNNEGDAPLHIVARTVKTGYELITDPRCDVNILNNDHFTPLLTAIKHTNPTVATGLLQRKCDATLCDPHGNTPLHLACIGGETQPEMVEVAKQLLTTVDPSCVNNAGQTPIELTTKYQLIQAISHIVKCKTKQSVQTYINMFIIGNPETGKSTLVKAICKEATSILWKIVPKEVRRVKNVPPHTAGIIPTTFRSKIFGNTVLYDLAGQVEYYTSHAAVIKSTVISTPPAFVVVVNLSESEENISQTLRYWWSFIENHAAQSSAPPQVILVGSHADVVKSTGGSVQEKMTQLSALLKQLSASFHFAGEVALDCRDPASRELRHFCSLVNQSCSVLRETADVDLRCHVLYAFLQERFKGKVACTVSNVATSVKETSELLPQNPESLIPLISTLSDKGLFLLVQGGKSHRNSWIILQKQALLSEINGVIFAPSSFAQHKDLSWSTGVVPFSKLKNQFPDYNPNMVCEFLTHLEFCFKIEDHETLALLNDEVANMEGTPPDVSEEYYFFPALVSVENPLHIWDENDDMCINSGWSYQCIRPDQFLATQFLHVLILRLAFTFALQLDPGNSRQDSLSIRRRCSVWKHGIAWLNRVPIETVVEVGLLHQSVVVMMRCPKGKEAECVQLRSEVIQKILEAKDEFCQAVKMSESFIHPDYVKYPFMYKTEDVKYFSLPEIAKVIVEKAANALDQRGRNPIPVQDLLLFDPSITDISTELLCELFSTKHSMDETVRSRVLETLNSESDK